MPQAQLTLADALKQLDAMPVPGGVDPVLFTSLKSGLRKVLIDQRHDKFTRQAPISVRSQVNDLVLVEGGSNTIAFKWTYRSEGDYDHSGQVWLTDLTPLGIHFGKDSTAADWNKAKIADGNNSGTVDISDLASIGINYTYSVTGYHIQYSLTGLDEASWNQVTDIPLASGDLNADGWRCFNVAAADEGAGYYRVVPYDSTGSGVAGQAVYYAGGGSTSHYETENNDTYTEADILPAMPFPTPLVDGNLGAGNTVDDDGDTTDWFCTTLTESGTLSLAMTFVGTTCDLDMTLYLDPLGAPLAFDPSNSNPEIISIEVAAGTYYLCCTAASGCGEYTISGTFTPQGSTTHYETEDNDDPTQADVLPPFPIASQSVTGNLGAGNTAGDDDGDSIDWFDFSVASMGTVTIDMYLNSSMGDLDLYLYSDPDGYPLAASESISDHEQISYYLDAAGTYYILCIVYDGYSEYALDGSFIPDTSNHAPSARIAADPYTGTPPLAVTLDASASTDPDPTDSIVKYEFDFGEGAGWQDFGATATADYTYNGTGSYLAKVRVTDSGGLTATASRRIFTDGTGDDTWNFMVWIAGDNNLAMEGFYDIQEMEVVGSTDQVNVLVGYDINPAYVTGSGCDEVHFIKVVQDNDASSINTTGDPGNASFTRAGYNSQDPQRLLEFLQWAAQYPAEHSVLVLWDHGSGWREGWKGVSLAAGKAKHAPRHGTGLPIRQHGASGVLCDDTDGTYDLTNNTFIVDTLEGYHFDMVVYDACNMGHIEASYDFRSLADWQVASEILVPGPGLPYDAILGGWNNNFPLAPNEIGQIMCDEFANEYSSDTVTMAVIDSGKIDALVSALGALAGSVKEKATAESDNVKDAIYDTYEPGSSDGERDLLGFLNNYRGLTSDGAIQGLLDNAIASRTDTCVYFRQVGQPDTTGLSVYLPSEWYFDETTRGEYGRTAFSVDSGWLDMLLATGVPGQGGTPEVEADWTAGDRVEISWTDSEADIDLIMRDPNFNYGSPLWPDYLFGEILFGPDNPGNGGVCEYGQLLSGAPAGEYLVSFRWYDYFGYYPPPTIEVHIELYNSSGALLQDLGSFGIGFYETKDYAILNYYP